MILFPSRCYNGGKRHNYQPRLSHTSTWPNGIQIESIPPLPEIIRAFKEQRSTYHGDVCSWCGHLVNARP